tara:strand:- start:5758 stop:6039 length:282 start_codon:yes stop_codon:yes gene_type:complete
MIVRIKSTEEGLDSELIARIDDFVDDFEFLGSHMEQLAKLYSRIVKEHYDGDVITIKNLCLNRGINEEGCEPYLRYFGMKFDERYGGGEISTK